MLCYVMLCYVMLCYVMLCYVMLCYVMLCYVMLCYVMLCYVMLYSVLYTTNYFQPRKSALDCLNSRLGKKFVIPEKLCFVKRQLISESVRLEEVNDKNSICTISRLIVHNKLM